MEEYARQIIEEAFDNVERLKGIEDDMARREQANIDTRTRPTGALPSWRRAPEKIKVTTEPDWGDWDEWARAHIKIALDAHDKLQHDVLAQVISDIRFALREEIKAVATSVKELQAELANLRESRGSVSVFPPKRKASDGAA
jgi:hypothetical protein